LKLNWPNQIFASIQNHFGGIQDGPFAIPQTMEEFEGSMLKKFMGLVKSLMQDTIYELTRTSYHDFVAYIKQKVPVQVTVEAIDQIKNQYNQEKEIEPIFVVDILKSLQSNEFIYSSNPQYYATVIMQIFDKAVTDIQKFQNLESKVANELIKASERHEKFLKTPQIPLSDPAEEDATQLHQKILNQENKWLWDLREELSATI